MSFFPAGIYVFKVNNENTRAMYEICSELTMSSEWRQWRRSAILIVNFEHILHTALIFSLLILSK